MSISISFGDFFCHLCFFLINAGVVVLAENPRSNNVHLFFPTGFDMAKKTFEAALTRLEQITDELENGDLSLENSLKKFDEGIKLAGFCSEQLSEARAKVEMLLEKNGKFETIPFEGQDREHNELS